MMDGKEQRRLSQLIEPGQSISKKSYVFDSKRSFNNVRKYKVTYTDGLSIQNIKVILADALAPKGKKPQHARPPVNYKALAFGALKIVIPIFLFLLILFALWFMMIPREPYNPPIPPEYSLNYSYRFVNTEVISFRTSLRSYATINFNGTGVNSTRILIRFYQEPIPRNVVLLRARNYETDKLEDFKANLSSMISASGLRITEMDIDQLMHLPDGAPMILVVPTGRVPSSFLGLDDPKFDFRKLMDNGVVIIYLGYKFSSGAISENGDVIVGDEVVSALRKLDLTFNSLPDQPKLTDGFRMSRADYTIASFGTTVYHRAISVLKGKKGGYLVTFPNTLKDGGGWVNGYDAAHDVYSLIRNLTWLEPYTSAPPYYIGNPDKDKPVSEVATIFSKPYGQRINLTAEFVTEVDGFEKNNETKIDFVYFPIVARGNLDHADWTLPTSLCKKNDGDNCNLYMTVDFNEPTSKDERMLIAAYRDGIKVYEKLIGVKKTQLVGEKLSFGVDLPGGDYVLKIESETGYVYAQSFLHVPKIEFWDRGFDFVNGRFWFVVLADGQRLPDNFDVKNVYISLDGQQNKSLDSYLDRDGQHRLFYQFSGVIPEGDHQFTINAGEYAQKINRNFSKRREFWENPLYQGALVLVAVMFAIGMLIRRPETAVYQIDVPDFPPLSKTKVPISREQACQIFELVNSDYRWRYMPLKHGEIKNGFRKLSYKGRPILVSDYNLERVLDQLTQEKLVKKSMEFYGLASWESSSGRSIEYLAVFRSLRDAFLNMSVHFSELGERVDCDIVVSAHERYYVHIYEGEDTVIKALATLPKGKTIIAFKDQDAADAFIRGLSSTSRSMIAAKLYIDNESLNVATPAGIDKIVK